MSGAAEKSASLPEHPEATHSIVLITAAIYFSRFPPDEIGLRETKGIYLIVSDADAVHATAKAAGAEMVLDIRDMDYGGRGFTCRDLEGHLWSIGTYDPWA